MWVPMCRADNIANLDWYYNNTLNKLTKADKPNTTQYYVYDCQGNRVRTVVESNNQAQSQRDYLPSLDLSIIRATLFGFSTTIVIWMDSEGLLPCAAIGLV
jgi:hypothetical protein